MNNISKALSGIFLLSPFFSAVASDNRPNILFILADDLSAKTLGCAGDSLAQTPVIDKLSEQGNRFSNAFVTTSISMASRASLFTGMYMCQHGVTDYQSPMPIEKTENVYPIRLKNGGYSTGFIGKFGFKIENNTSPENWFDYYKPVDQLPVFKIQADGSEKHITATMCENAIEFLKTRDKKKPFCLSISFHDVHAIDGDLKAGRAVFPYQKETEKMYVNTIFPNPTFGDEAIFNSHPEFMRKSENRIRYMWRFDTPEKYQENMRAYYRMIAGMDNTIGKVIAELKRLKLDKNTIIVFMSDNGFFLGDRGFADKWNHYEESLRVPLVIYDPRLPKSNAGKVIEKMALNIDIASTFLDWAKLPCPQTYMGKSLTTLLENSQTNKWDRAEFYCEHGHKGKTIPKWRGIRGERYVYANYFEFNYEYLHDLEKDPNQLVNLAHNREYQIIINKFRAQTNKYHKEFSNNYQHPEAQRVPFVEHGKYQNPILGGDYPDPTVLKVGNAWYMTHSSFEYVPGLLIWKSTDLIHWTPIKYALNKFIGSIYAPDLIEHKGKFYIYFPAKNINKPGFSNWVVTADNIEGEWSEPVDLKVGNIDPGHVVDADGNRYLYLSDGLIVALSADGLSVNGKPQKAYEHWQYPADWLVEGLCLEGPKALYRNGYYYLTLAQGGTAGPATSHMVVSARSKSVFGPWEFSPHNPIVRTKSVDEKWWSKGHGTVFEGPQGKWFVMYHAYQNGFSTLGRQTLMEPIEWTSDGWFYVKNENGAEAVNAVPMKSINRPHWHGGLLSDDFKSKKLSWQWRFFEGENSNRISITDNGLALTAKGTTPGNSVSLLTIPTNENYEVEVEIEITNDCNAGIILFYDPLNYVALGFSEKGLVRYKFNRPAKWEKLVSEKRVFLKMRNIKHQVAWLYSENGVDWKQFPQSSEVSGLNHNTFGKFLSLRVGIYATGNGIATFRNFKYKGLM